MRENSQEYLKKRRFFDGVLTIYGRNSVLEALDDTTLKIYRLHLSKSNRDSTQLKKMVTLAKNRDIEILYHSKKALSQISKNAKQDQGVALDIIMPNSMSQDDFILSYNSYRVVALDGINNPQNLGMIIRSCSAGDIDAIILPTKNSAQISPLVIKASVGTLFKIPIIKSHNLYQTLQEFKKKGATLYRLSSYANRSYREIEYANRSIFVVGNESVGVSSRVEDICDISISIPMRRGVESLNVAVSVSLIAFLT